MATGIDPTTDYVFKRLCGDEENALVLVNLLNAVLDFPAGKAVTGVAMLNPFVAQDAAEGKVPILDVRARDDPGRQFLLEMQQFVRPGFDKRLLWYWAGAHAEQLLKGDRYEMLLPTYGICFVNQPLFQDAAWHHCFHVYDDEHGVLLCKDLEIHLLELSKFDVGVEEVRTPLERWCYFFKHGPTLGLENLAATLDVPAIRKAVEVLVKISQDELQRQRMLEQQRIDRDARSLAADARVAKEEARAAQENLKVVQENLKVVQENLKVAQEEARIAKRAVYDAGIEKGKIIGRIQLYQQFLGQAETSIQELGALPEETLMQMEDSLKRQLSARKQTNGTSPADTA